MTDFSHVAQQVYAFWQLANFSQASDNMDRRYRTQHQQANEQVANGCNKPV